MVCSMVIGLNSELEAKVLMRGPGAVSGTRTDAVSLVAASLNLDRRTIFDWLHEYDTSDSFTDARSKGYVRYTPTGRLWVGHVQVLRAWMWDQRMKGAGAFTINDIRELLMDISGINMTRSTMYRALLAAGFHFGSKQKLELRKDRPTIAARRVAFVSNDLLHLSHHPETGQPIRLISLDESYLHQTHNTSRCWGHKDEIVPRRSAKDSGRGRRLILVGAITKGHGLIKEAMWVFPYKSTGE